MKSRKTVEADFCFAWGRNSAAHRNENLGSNFLQEDPADFS
jgi:hypothetical protein